jgi:hypothetical protein
MSAACTLLLELDTVPIPKLSGCIGQTFWWFHYRLQSDRAYISNISDKRPPIRLLLILKHEGCDVRSESHSFEEGN